MLGFKISSLKRELKRRGLNDKVEQAEKNWGHDKEFLVELLERIIMQDNKDKFLKM